MCALLISLQENKWENSFYNLSDLPLFDSVACDRLIFPEPPEINKLSEPRYLKEQDEGHFGEIRYNKRIFSFGPPVLSIVGTSNVFITKRNRFVVELAPAGPSSLCCDILFSLVPALRSLLPSIV